MSSQKMELEYIVKPDGKVIQTVINRGAVNCNEAVSIAKSIGQIEKDDRISDGCPPVQVNISGSGNGS